MPNDFCLLFKPISSKRPTHDNFISVSAEWVTHQRKVEAASRLSLPDVRHLVNKEPLKGKPLL